MPIKNPFVPDLDTESDEFSSTIRLGVFPNAVCPQDQICNGKPVYIKVVYCENYLLDAASITRHLYNQLQKNYYIDVVYGKNSFLYLTPFGACDEEKTFSISMTRPGSNVVYGSAGTKLRIMNDNINAKAFPSNCLGFLSERRVLSLLNVIHDHKPCDLVFGPNCVEIVNFFKNKCKLENINSLESWKNTLNITDCVFNEQYISKNKFKVVHKNLNDLLDYWESDEFVETYTELDAKKDISILDKLKGKTVREIVSMITRSDSTSGGSKLKKCCKCGKCKK